MGANDPAAQRAALLIANIYEAAGRLRRAGDAVARAAGQSQARWQVLAVLSAEGSWTVPRIADRLGVTRQNVQRIVDELHDDGLATFSPNERRTRSPFVHITNGGQRVLNTLGASSLRLDLRVAHAIGENDLEQVDAALGRLLVMLRGRSGEPTP